MEEEKKIQLSLDKYTECIVALQKLKDIKAIALQWKRGAEQADYDTNIIGDDDAVLAILSIVQYN